MIFYEMIISLELRNIRTIEKDNDNNAALSEKLFLF